MSTHKHIDFICVAVLVCTLLLTVLFINGESFGLEVPVDGDAENSSDSAWFTGNDRDGDWSVSGAARIRLSGDRAYVSGGGAYFYDGDVVIARPGRYVVSGTLDDGSVIVDTDSDAKVWILLDGADISCADDACLRIEQADKVFLTLADASENSMRSGASYRDSAVEGKVGGVIFSRDDLTVNGSGSLTVTAAYKHGFDVNDELVITGGSITVDAAEDGLHVNDGLRIERCALTIRAGDKGIQLQNQDALLCVASGSIAIDSGDDGIKSEADMLLEGGTIEIHAGADGLHSASRIAASGSALTISAGDDGIHADREIAVSGGSVLIPSCYEGMEALTIDISGGEIELYPTDDGLNANGGSGFGRAPWPDSEDGAAEDSETWIHISGGSLTIVNENAREADGLDSNGDIVISGGVIRVSLPSSGSNNAIDYGSESGGVCVITGGELVACGSSAMAEGFSDSSTQCALLFRLGYSAEAGSTVLLRDAAGEELLRCDVPCSFSCAALSSPEMKPGESYTLVIGEKETEITLDAVNTTVGGSSGFGGMGRGFGGMPPQGMAEGDRPTPPDFSNFDGERPDFSDRPAPPSGGMRPDFSGGGADFPRQADGGTMPAQEADAEPQSTAEPDPTAQNLTARDPESELSTASDPTAENLTAPVPVSAATWGMLAACVLVLACGIGFAVKYRP